MNALIMFDRETGSLWSHLLSEGIGGTFKGQQLTNVPVVLTNWSEWKTSFPDTKALYKSGRGYDPYTVYYQMGDAGVIGESNRDDRLYGKELVLGTGFDDGAIAFPHTTLSTEQIINTEINGEPAVIYFNAQTNTATVYSRVVDDETLEFSLITESDVQGLMRDWLVDASTDSKWLPLNGQAWSGELQGTRLRSLHAVNVFWFAWSDYYPETEIYGE